ncbi:RNA-binding S4 domain-containing protein [Aquabacterium sp. J223]|uniref:RNA-binding S4 domain-containing protein n=1 Tax=Aquabacterium sp. J223 TaxID=2898431 RepID=UPI0021AD81C6|nr:RNA-binding S4 domain-containing protein [Aquabacterium sp. J223]UUX93962.1 RNA-binding S4 domain-containing protein [Aquabacterium sp. J223]
MTRPADTTEPMDFPLRGDHIALDALLKATGAVPSGGAAKQLIADGGVSVDGRPELRRSAKLRAGQVVTLAGWRIRLTLPAAGGPAPAPA